jgi:hypothetical protein
LQWHHHKLSKGNGIVAAEDAVRGCKKRLSAEGLAARISEPNGELQMSGASERFHGIHTPQASGGWGSAIGSSSGWQGTTINFKRVMPRDAEEEEIIAIVLGDAFHTHWGPFQHLVRAAPSRCSRKLTFLG